MPVMAPIEHIKRGRATLTEMAQQAGRDPKSIQVLAFGFPGQLKDKAELKDLADAGIDHVTIWLEGEGDATVKDLDNVAKKVLN
jgi:hypothetical protein